MVQLMGSGNHHSDPETALVRERRLVKLEIEDPLEEENGPINKRSKSSLAPKEIISSDASLGDASAYSILDEPSPLGLRLKKSPSLLDLIQMKLSQGSVPVTNTESDNLSCLGKKDTRAAAGTSSVDKLKASNFPASLLKIGTWEYKSKYEGDLVAKCYFAKHKLVWEILEGGLKSKIEIQWSDITALKANCPEDGPSSLSVVLARQPLFFRETNPQPRKHTLWQATSDFTDGQASKHRQHLLQCPQGLLTKHFEKLIQCDARLNFLSQQPDIILDSPHFETRPSSAESADNPKDHDVHQVNSKGSAVSSFLDVQSPIASLSPSFTIEHNNPPAISIDSLPREAPSPSSVMDCRAIEGSSSSEAESKAPRNWDEIKVPGLRPSMSVSDFLGHIEHCLSEQITSEPEYQEMLEDIAQYLLSDNQAIGTAASDEKSLMSRVNSLCCLLQKDPPTVQNSHDHETVVEGPDRGKGIQLAHTHETVMDDKSRIDFKILEEDSRDVSSSKQAPGMSRKDSFGELLLHLPRIASLPKFLFNISEEDSDSQGR
ncbi:uncharacterized protein LOC130936731 [Arachis stenosperma]|uniref:uncharacterized protein LOC130936731 n=1 Tax=Arachis stenosperma TaxID=217475 RepID=UPI0025ACB1E4|nr:uncharacterized protein LOC130936731 [Arachis stenosperma]